MDNKRRKNEDNWIIIAKQALHEEKSKFFEIYVYTCKIWNLELIWNKEKIFEWRYIYGYKDYFT